VFPAETPQREALVLFIPSRGDLPMRPLLLPDSDWRGALARTTGLHTVPAGDIVLGELVLCAGAEGGSINTRATQLAGRPIYGNAAVAQVREEIRKELCRKSEG
jgi:hypothetical protein